MLQGLLANFSRFAKLISLTTTQLCDPTKNGILTIYKGIKMKYLFTLLLLSLSMFSYANEFSGECKGTLIDAYSDLGSKMLSACNKIENTHALVCVNALAAKYTQLGVEMIEACASADNIYAERATVAVITRYSSLGSELLEVAAKAGSDGEAKCIEKAVAKYSRIGSKFLKQCLN